MSGTICSSCGASNASGLVYCSSCGGTLPSSVQPSPSTAPSAVAQARRRQLLVREERPSRPSLFSRLGRLIVYLLLVASGVVLVLALMEDPRMVSHPEGAVPNARSVLDRIMQSARYSPAVISQTVANSLLAQQGPITIDSPVPPVPMPSWEATAVEFRKDGVLLRVTVSVLGHPVGISESFHLQGRAGDWGLAPQSASIGLVGVPRFLLPVATFAMRPAVMPFSKDLEILSKAGLISIRPGMVEFALR
jgi:hypothetical protein